MVDRLNSSAKANAPSVNHESFKKSDKFAIQDVDPTGVLAIHIKRCRNLKIQDGSKAFSKRLPVNLYLKVVVGDVTKTTSVNEVRCSNNVGMVIDDLKHFLVCINNKLDDESNKMRFMLMGYQGNNKHKKLGDREIHLFNIVKNLFIVETIEVTKNAHVMGEIEIEMAFSYGCFGYGYSSQLESKTHSHTEQISQSLFYRAEPPSDRKHDSKYVMTAVPTPHPTFIKWPVQVNIVLGGKEYLTDSVTELMSGKPPSKMQFPLLVEHMSQRMPELQKRYASFTKRSQRLNFLQNLVTTKINPDLEENQDEMLFSKDVMTERDRSPDSLDHHEEEMLDEEDDEPKSFFSKLTAFFGFRSKSKENYHNMTHGNSIEEGSRSRSMTGGPHTTVHGTEEVK